MDVPIELDSPRNLRLDFRALKDLEARSNGEPLALIVQKLNQLSLTTISIALFVALKHQDPHLTPAKTERMLIEYLERGGTLQTVLAGLNQALMESGVLRTQSDVEEAEGNAQKAGIQTATPIP